MPNKILKGQVWYILGDIEPRIYRYSRLFDGKPITSHDITKRRPWLVLSCRNDDRKYTHKYARYLCVPISGQFYEDDSGIPISISGKPGLLWFDQAKTHDQILFDEYIETLSPAEMERIELEWAKYLDIDAGIRFDQYLEKSLESLANYQKLLFSIKGSRIRRQREVQKEEEKPLLKTEEVKNTQQNPKTKKRTEWNEAMIENFLNDCRTLNISEVANKYGFTIGTTRFYKSKFGKIRTK